MLITIMEIISRLQRKKVPPIGGDFSGKAKTRVGIPGNSREFPFPGIPIPTCGGAMRRKGLGIPSNSREFPFPGIPNLIPTPPIGRANPAGRTRTRIRGCCLREDPLKRVKCHAQKQSSIRLVSSARVTEQGGIELPR